MCIQTCMLHSCVGIYICMHCMLPYIFSQGLSRKPAPTNWLNWRATELPPALGWHTDMCHPSWLLPGTGGLSSSPHACIAGALLAEPHPQPALLLNMRISLKINVHSITFVTGVQGFISFTLSFLETKETILRIRGTFLLWRREVNAPEIITGKLLFAGTAVCIFRVFPLTLLYIFPPCSIRPSTSFRGRISHLLCQGHGWAH